MPKISHFDIPDDDPVRVQKFYVFDWKFDKWNGPVDYWMVKTGDEEMGLTENYLKECLDKLE